jgi:enterochelin esterase-like enzyme
VRRCAAHSGTRRASGDHQGEEENRVLEPQATGFFLLLIVVFAALLFWVAVAKQVVFRVFAACLAFIPAMMFGVAAVNKYYDYYQTWGAALSDLNGGTAANLPNLAAGGLNKKKLQQDLNRSTNLSEDQQFGTVFDTTVTGPKTHIKREVLVYLPPQYFQTAYAHYKFPVIELLHGSPGNPSAWINVMDVTTDFLTLLTEHKAQPAVLVMPDTDGGMRYSLQCLNDPTGVQDMTFVAKEVPAAITAALRVQPPGKSWGIAGYSEGGYCAANIALNYPGDFGTAGVLSGYFAPITSQVPLGGKPGGEPVLKNVFADYPELLLKNSPAEYITRVPIGLEIPQFWLAAGEGDKGDVDAAREFQQLAEFRQVNVPLDIIPGGHTGSVWRAALGPMFIWMTPQLALSAEEAEQYAARHAHAAKTAKGAKPSPTRSPAAHTTPPAKHTHSA